MVTHLNPVFDGGIIALSIGLSFLGSYITICFCEQFRLCTLGAYKSNFLGRSGLFILMALALGGVGMWSMSFIALSSLKIMKYDGDYEVVHFSIYPTIIALFASLCLSFLGLYVSSLDKMFGKTKQEIVERFVSDTQKLSFQQIKRMTHFRLLFTLATEELSYFLSGGIIAGSGMTLSVCLAIWSMGLSHMTIEWNVGVICAAVIFSWFASTLVFWILFRLLSVYPHMEWLRMFSAFLMAGTISSVHFIAFAGISFQNHPGQHQDDSHAFEGTLHIHERLFYTVTVIAAIMFCYILSMMAFSDLRTWIYNMSDSLRQHQDLLDILKREPAQAEIISVYIRKHPNLAINHRYSAHSSQEESKNSADHNNDNNNNNNNINPAETRPKPHINTPQRMLSEHGDRNVESNLSVVDKTWSFFTRLLPVSERGRARIGDSSVHYCVESCVEVQTITAGVTGEDEVTMFRTKEEQQEHDLIISQEVAEKEEVVKQNEEVEEDTKV